MFHVCPNSCTLTDTLVNICILPLFFSILSDCFGNNSYSFLGVFLNVINTYVISEKLQKRNSLNITLQPIVRLLPDILSNRRFNPTMTLTPTAPVAKPARNSLCV